MAPLAQTLTLLQEENKILRNEQERVLGRVEALCQVMGLKHPLFEQVPSADVPANTIYMSEPPFSSESANVTCPMLCLSENTEIVAQKNKVDPQDSSENTDSPVNLPEYLTQDTKGALQGSVISPLEFVSALEDANNTASGNAGGALISATNGSEESLLCLHNFECALPKGNTSPDYDDSNSALNSPIGVPQGSVLGTQDFTDVLTGTTSEPTNLQSPSKEANSELNSPVGLPQGCNMEPQAFECSSNNRLNFEETAHGETAGPVPAFSKRRSLSAPSLVGYTPNSTVPLVSLVMHVHLIIQYVIFDCSD